MPITGDYRAFGLTDVGQQRDHNEDCFGIDESMKVYIVSDGLGGHAAGEIASAAVVEIVLREIRNNEEVFQAYVDNPNFYNRARVTDAVEMSIETASREIYQMGTELPERYGMGATIALLILLGQSAIVAHVGDSRVYVCRNGQQHQLTLDHSMTRLKLHRGLISRKEAEALKTESAMARAIGVTEMVQVDTLHLELMPGDTFLLCSDGLSDYFQKHEFAEAVNALDLAEIPKHFIRLANKRGGKDNITAVVVQVVDCQAGPEDATVARKVEVLRGIPLFASLSYREIVMLLELVQIRSYDINDRILCEGDPGDELFVSLSGSVEVTKSGQRLAQLGRGAFFGEMSLIDRAPRSADVIARDVCKMMVIRREDFDELIAEAPALGVKLLRAFCRVLNERLRNTSEVLAAAANVARPTHVTPDKTR